MGSGTVDPGNLNFIARSRWEGHLNGMDDLKLEKMAPSRTELKIGWTTHSFWLFWQEDKYLYLKVTDPQITGPALSNLNIIFTKTSVPLHIQAHNQVGGEWLGRPRTAEYNWQKNTTRNEYLIWGKFIFWAQQISNYRNKQKEFLSVAPTIITSPWRQKPRYATAYTCSLFGKTGEDQRA